MRENIRIDNKIIATVNLSWLLRKDLPHKNIHLVLDEPTAAIDPIEETKLYKLFDEMSVGKTSIFVTYRLGSVLFSDLVIFLEDGHIAEMGTHEELLKRDGKYATYYLLWQEGSSL